MSLQSKPFRAKSAARHFTKPLSIVPGSRPCSAKQWFEVNNHRRNEEAWKLEEWQSTVSDNKKREWQAKYHNVLADPKNNYSSEDDWKSLEKKKNILLERKHRLRKLLRSDEERYEKERQRRGSRKRTDQEPPNIYPEIEMLRKKLDDLKKKNEEEQLKISEKLSYEVWKKNSSQMRELESERLNQFVQDAWVDQKQWKDDQKRKRELEQRKAEVDYEESRKLKEEEQRKLDEERQARHVKWKTELDEQLKMVKEKEQNEVHLMQLEEKLNRETSKLDEIMQRRDQTLEVRKRQELELFWARQHQLKLKRKAAAIQTELMQDQDLIDDILKTFPADREDVQKRREEIEWMRCVLEEQKKLEKLREKEYELLFSEEARQMWDRRQAEWDRERKARDKLIKDVLFGLKKQISEKMDACTSSIVKSSEERSILISDMQLKQDKIGEEEEEKRRNVEENGFGSHEGTGDTNYDRYMQEKSVNDHNREIVRLEAEMRKLWQCSYTPPQHGRKKVAWQ